MVSRYTRVFTLGKNLYQKSSPVIVSAGALLKDNKENKIVAQLKIKNVSSNIIRAVKIILHTFDTAGNPIDSDTIYEYLDLSIPTYEEFGQQVAIAIKDNVTRSFTLEVISVVFNDNSVWKSESKEWTEQPPISSVIHEEALAKQYIKKNCEKSRNVPLEYEDLWICSCGAINRRNEQTCYECKCSKKNVFNINLEELRSMNDYQHMMEKYSHFGRYSPESQVLAKPLEWIKIAEENGRILILSKYIIESKKFDDTRSKIISWNDCTIRKWLNGYFFEHAFTGDEKADIIDTDIDGEIDKVFLLSTEEVEKYFKDNSERICKTMFQLGGFARLNSWLLRTTTKITNCSANVQVQGDTGKITFATRDKYGIRPAMWVKID